MATKCSARQGAMSPVGRVVQIMRTFWCEPGCIKTDDVISLREKMENKYPFTVENVYVRRWSTDVSSLGIQITRLKWKFQTMTKDSCFFSSHQ